MSKMTPSSDEAPIGRGLGGLAAILSLVAAVAINMHAFHLGRSWALQAAYAYCGTGLFQKSLRLMFVVPFMIIVPLGAWWIARQARHGQLLARCGLWASVAGWLTCVSFLFWT